MQRSLVVVMILCFDPGFVLQTKHVLHGDIPWVFHSLKYVVTVNSVNNEQLVTLQRLRYKSSSRWLIYC